MPSLLNFVTLRFRQIKSILKSSELTLYHKLFLV